MTTRTRARLIPADAYIFDIDGTLLNSRDGVQYHAICDSLREIYGVCSDLNDVHVHGNTDVGILRAAVNKAGKDQNFEERLPAALAFVRAQVGRNRVQMKPEVCPSIARLLEELAREGKLLGVASGLLESVAWAKLEAAGLRDYFSFGSFSDACELRENIFRNAISKAHEIFLRSDGNTSAAQKVCFVGDTPSDIAAAHAIGVPIVAVATGIFTAEQLAQHSPDLCLSCSDELFS